MSGPDQFQAGTIGREGLHRQAGSSNPAQTVQLTSNERLNNSLNSIAVSTSRITRFIDRVCNAPQPTPSDTRDGSPPVLTLSENVIRTGSLAEILSNLADRCEEIA